MIPFYWLVLTASHVKSISHTMWQRFKLWQPNRTVLKVCSAFKLDNSKTPCKANKRQCTLSSPPPRRFTSTRGEGNAATHQENRFSKSSLFLSLITNRIFAFHSILKPIHHCWLGRGGGPCNFHCAPVTQERTPTLILFGYETAICYS